MQRYRIRHVTEYRYQRSVTLAHHMLHLALRPVDHQHHAVQKITIEPPPAVTAERIDSFGNPVTYLAMQEPHAGLVIAASSEIDIAPRPTIAAAATPAWEALRDRIALSRDDATHRAEAFAYNSPRIPYLPSLLDYAAPSFPAQRPIALAAIDLTRRIHQDFIFDPDATHVSTQVQEVLTRRRGVCQDLAHVGIGCLRALGLPARYVSGYLRTEPPPGGVRLEGADASHAWISVWCGEAGWLDLDPTNDKIVDTDYITLAWGRDYGDVSPVRGVLFGGGGHSLSVKVDVEPI